MGPAQALKFDWLPGFRRVCSVMAAMATMAARAGYLLIGKIMLEWARLLRYTS